MLNLDPEKSLTLVLYREFQQLKKKEEHDYVSKDTLIKFMQTLSGKNLLIRELFTYSEMNTVKLQVLTCLD